MAHQMTPLWLVVIANLADRHRLRSVEVECSSQPLARSNSMVAIQLILIAIARALEILSPKVLIHHDGQIHDLYIHETNLLFDVMRRLKNEGIGIIFVDHTFFGSGL